MKKIISPTSNISLISYIKLIWKYRFFSRSLAIGKIKNKYAKMISGLLFMVIQMLIGLCVYWLVFGIAIGINTNNIPYPIFALPGILAWHLFSNIIGTSSGALTNYQHIINKFYLPKINLLFAEIIPGIIEFIIGFVVFVILFIVFGQSFNILWLLVPLIFIIIVFFSLSIGIWAAILSLYFPDISQIIMQVTNFLIFATPVFYPGSIIPQNFKFILYINPIASVIEYFRAFTLDSQLPSNWYLISAAMIIIIFISGFYIFKKIEKKIADLL